MILSTVGAGVVGGAGSGDGGKGVVGDVGAVVFGSVDAGNVDTGGEDGGGSVVPGTGAGVMIDGVAGLGAGLGAVQLTISTKATSNKAKLLSFIRPPSTPNHRAGRLHGLS